MGAGVDTPKLYRNFTYGTKIKGLGFAPNATVEHRFDNRASRSGRLARLVVALKNIGPTASYL